MSKVELDHIGTDSFQSIGRHNSNMDKIETGFENTLSRDGTGPNQMDADLDMNSNRVINLPLPVNSSEAASKAYVDAVAQSLVNGGGTGSLDYEVADQELEARVTDQITVVVTDTEALASRVSTVEAQYSGIVDEDTGLEATLSALVSSEQTARASADAALASRLDIVEASVESPNTELAATVSSHTTAIADLTTNKASASSVTAVTARVDNLEDDIDAAQAAITTEATARASADAALATRVDSVEASIGTPSGEFVARITNAENAIVDLNTNKASTSSVNTLTSSVNGLSSTVSTQASAIASVDGKLNSSYGITVDSGGRASSLKLLSNGSTSAFKVRSDNFVIESPTGGQRFEYSGGNIRIYDSAGTLRVRLGVW